MLNMGFDVIMFVLKCWYAKLLTAGFY